jgi:hypothetical protein
MKETKTLPSIQKEIHSSRAPLFEKANMMWMLGGVVVMILGFILMSGGRSDNPNVFEPGEVYSTVRITVAPVLILAGLVIEIFAIFKHPKNK